MFYKRDWLVFFVIIVLVFLAAGRTALDADMWWHLRVGEETFARGLPSLIDHLSFTHANQPWTNHSWLSQVIFFVAFKLGGFAGIGILVASLAAISMGLVYFQISGRPILRAFIIVLGSLVAAVAWSPRPQMVSWVLISLTGLILYLYKWKNRDLLWWLPVLFILWSNLHGGYTFGLIMIGVTIAGEITNRFLNTRLSRALSWREIGRIGLVAVFCGLAVLINPNGINMWLIPFQTVDSSVQFISEWASPDFHQLYQQPLLWLLLGTMVAFAFSGQRADCVDLLSILVFGFMALTSRRFYGPFALVATPVFSRYLWLGWQSFRAKPDRDGACLVDDPPGRFIPGWQKVINLGLVGTLFLAGLLKVSIVNNPVFVENSLAASLPAGAVKWVRSNSPAGNMLNEYNWGGYLSWTLRDHPVFIDGRADLYGDCGIREWVDLVQAGQFWETILDGYSIGFTILEPDRPIVRELLTRGWIRAYGDTLAIVLVRPAGP